MAHVRVATFDGPGAPPVIREVPRPEVPEKAALIRIGACGVCGTDLHILKGHWPTPLPWPFTLGHEVTGVVAEIGPGLTEDFMGRPLEVGAKVMLPPVMPCGRCYYCVHYPETANKCLTPVYYGRYLGFEKPPHLWGGWAEMVYVDLEDLPGTKVYRLPDDMPLGLASLSEPLTSAVRAFERAKKVGGFPVGATVVIQGSGPIGVLAVAAAQGLHGQRHPARDRHARPRPRSLSVARDADALPLLGGGHRRGRRRRDGDADGQVDDRPRPRARGGRAGAGRGAGARPRLKAGAGRGAGARPRLRAGARRGAEARPRLRAGSLSARSAARCPPGGAGQRPAGTSRRRPGGRSPRGGRAAPR